jgi:hypothetical protein
MFAVPRYHRVDLGRVSDHEKERGALSSHTVVKSYFLIRHISRTVSPSFASAVHVCSEPTSLLAAQGERNLDVSQSSGNSSLSCRERSCALRKHEACV